MLHRRRGLSECRRLGYDCLQTLGHLLRLSRRRVDPVVDLQANTANGVGLAARPLGEPLGPAQRAMRSGAVCYQGGACTSIGPLTHAGNLLVDGAGAEVRCVASRKAFATSRLQVWSGGRSCRASLTGRKAPGRCDRVPALLIVWIGEVSREIHHQTAGARRASPRASRAPRRTQNHGNRAGAFVFARSERIY